MVILKYIFWAKQTTTNVACERNCLEINVFSFSRLSCKSHTYPIDATILTTTVRPLQLLQCKRVDSLSHYQSNQRPFLTQQRLRTSYQLYQLILGQGSSHQQLSLATSLHILVCTYICLIHQCVVTNLMSLLLKQKVEVNDTNSRAYKDEPVVETPEESETEVKETLYNNSQTNILIKSLFLIIHKNNLLLQLQ